MNNSSHIHVGYCDFSTAGRRFDAFLFIAISVISIIGNSIIFVVYIRHRVLRNTTNVFIISLSASDMIVAVLSIPFSFGTFLCNVLPQEDQRSLENILYTACDILPSILSIYSLSLVAVDRAVVILHPFIHKKYVNQRSASITVGIMWITCISVVALLLFIMDWSQFTLFAIFIAYVIPVAIMIVSYAVVGYVAKKHAKDINKLERTVSRLRVMHNESPALAFKVDKAQVTYNDSNDSLLNNLVRNDSVPCIKSNALVPKSLQWLPTPQYSKKSSINLGVKCLWREIKAALKLSFILSCFVISWTPFMALNIEHFSHPNKNIGIKVLMYFKLLHYSNSALNPLLYILLNKTWKAAFKMTICCKKEKRRLTLKSVIGW